jgi:hypothetical protein
MAQIKKNTSYFEKYHSAGTNALYESLKLCKEHNIETIDLEDKDIYIHYHHAYGTEVKVSSLTYDKENHKIYLDGIDSHLDVDSLEDGETNSFEDIDLEDDCLLVDAIFIYEALVDCINENNPTKHYYMVNISGYYGYSFMVESSEELTELEVIDIASERDLFNDITDRHSANVDDLVTDADIEHFKKINCCYNVD